MSQSKFSTLSGNISLLNGRGAVKVSLSYPTGNAPLRRRRVLRKPGRPLAGGKDSPRFPKQSASAISTQQSRRAAFGLLRLTADRFVLTLSGNRGVVKIRPRW